MLQYCKTVMSITYHPGTDGQTERTIGTGEHMLQHCVNRVHDDWDEHLDAAEFSIDHS